MWPLLAGDLWLEFEENNINGRMVVTSILTQNVAWKEVFDILPYCVCLENYIPGQ